MSIKDIEPIRVTTLPDGRMKVVDGHHRLQAAKEAGMTTVPVVEHDYVEESARHMTQGELFKLKKLLTDMHEQEGIYQHSSKTPEINTIHFNRQRGNHAAVQELLKKGAYASMPREQVHSLLFDKDTADKLNAEHQAHRLAFGERRHRESRKPRRG